MRVIFALAILASLTACQGSAQIEGEGFRINTQTDGHRGGFCPPGQAKKGRC